MQRHRERSFARLRQNFRKILSGTTFLTIEKRLNDGTTHGDRFDCGLGERERVLPGSAGRAVGIMKMHIVGMPFQETGRDRGPHTTRSPGRATRIEVVQERVRTAALRGCPVEIEAATRAYRTEANLALLADLWGLMLLKMSTVWRRVRGRRHTSPCGTEREP